MATKTFSTHAEQARVDNPTEMAYLDSFSVPFPSYLDPMWQHAKNIEGANWNKSFPYQLLILGKDNAKIHQFTLPIPPEALTISTPFAINTQVTLGGIVEEHNGTPIRALSFSGTLGVLPTRTNAAAQSFFSATDILAATGGIGAGTILAASAVAQSRAQAVANIFGPNQLFWNTASEQELKDSGGIQGTGYYQFQLLQKFLETYASAKKHSENRDLRLAVAIWKDQAIYIVTPVSFEVRRSAASPLEYMYSLQFKAWKRISRLDAAAATGFVAKQPPRMVLQNVLALLSEARQMMQDLKNIAAAVLGDIGQLFEVVRQAILYVKDAISAAITLAELPADLALEIMRNSAEILRTAAGAVSEVKGDVERLKSKYSLDTLNDAARDVDRAFYELMWETTTAADRAVLEGYAGGIVDEAFAIMSKKDIASMALSPATREKADAMVALAAGATRTDLETSLNTVQEAALQYAKAVGAIDSEEGTSKRSPTEDDYNFLFALNQTAIALSKLVVLSSKETAKEDAIAYVAGLATQSGIAFQQPTAKIAVPFPYASTLEQVAARYLGDPKRWHEIAALNGLRSPYVDEEGFEMTLLSNGRGNQVVVASPENLFVGQPVTLSATNTPRTARRITKIDTINSQMTIIHLSGEEDLGRYTVMGEAILHAYLPDTVNSQMQIYVPSTSTPREDNLTSKTIPGVDEFDPMISAGGVDLLLTPGGDLAVTQDGDCKLAVGLTNLVQRVRIALGTPKGTLPQHPDFGLGLLPGTSTADINANQLLEATRGMFSNDPAFTGVYSASVIKKGPGLSLSVNVGIAGQDIVLPVSVDVKS